MTVARDWAARVGDAWADEWQRTDRSFADLATHLDAAILAVAPERGQAIDIGCGAGATSIALALARPGLRVVGRDLSPTLVDIARSRSTSIANLSFEVADVAAPEIDDGPFDLLVSRHGVMFFDEPVAGLSAMRRRAAPGAPIVFSCFRAAPLNIWAIETITAITGEPPGPGSGYAPSPFAFADPAFVTATLHAAGWGDVTSVPVDFTYRAGAGDDPVADAVDFFTRIGPAAPLLRAASADRRAGMLERLAGVATRHLRDGAVDFAAAAWLWSARAA